jgi:hypothetical protein
VMRMMDYIESLKKDIKRWSQLGELCREHNKQNLSVIREVTQSIRRKNEEKYQELTRSGTDPVRRWIIITELFSDDLLLALTGEKNPYSPLHRRTCPNCGKSIQINERVCPYCKKNLEKIRCK